MILPQNATVTTLDQVPVGNFVMTLTGPSLLNVFGFRVDHHTVNAGPVPDLVVINPAVFDRREPFLHTTERDIRYVLDLGVQWEIDVRVDKSEPYVPANDAAVLHRSGPHYFLRLDIHEEFLELGTGKLVKKRLTGGTPVAVWSSFSVLIDGGEDKGGGTFAFSAAEAS